MPANRREELLQILQEEAAEVIQAASKQVRFGVNTRNQDHLELEMGDLAGVIKLLLMEGYVSDDKVCENAEAKIVKLDGIMTFKREPV
jgi:NTP pyrophosphatase (non-canonical NTP hydrolase)